MREERFKSSVAGIEGVVEQFPNNRTLAKGELGLYDHKFSIGWEIAGLCGEPTTRLRVLLPESAPYDAPRIAVFPSPTVLSWPHLEGKGLLCLIPEAGSFSTENTVALLKELLASACELVRVSIAGDNVEEFEDEFQSYWIQWRRIKEVTTVLCRPRGPSRIVHAYVSRGGSFVADDEETLRSWLANRFANLQVKGVTFDRIPLLWLPRPPRPAEYPSNIGNLRLFLRRQRVRTGMLDNALLGNENLARSMIMIGFQGRRGPGFAGLRIMEATGLGDGFRKPPRDILLQRHNSTKLKGALAHRADVEWVHGRDHNDEVERLRDKEVVLLGLGSVGSSVADLLAKVGVGHLTVVDGGELEHANTSRHLLGADHVGRKKSESISKVLRERFPHLAVKSIAEPLATAVKNDPNLFKTTSLVISTTGSWSAESLLNDLQLEDVNFPPVLFGWTEPHAAAGHALVFVRGAACLRCTMDSLGHDRIPVTQWPKAGTLVPVPACGGHFQPYGATALTYIHALIADLAVDVLMRRVTVDAHRVWIGRHDLLTRAEGMWSPQWLEAYEDPGMGGRVVDVPVTRDQTCPACSNVNYETIVRV